MIDSFFPVKLIVFGMEYLLKLAVDLAIDLMGIL